MPHAFMATKAITHPLVRPQAVAPEGWSPRFADRVREVVLPGFSVFTIEDALTSRSGVCWDVECSAPGELCVQPVGKIENIIDEAELEIALAALDANQLAQDGRVRRKPHRGNNA